MKHCLSFLIATNQPGANRARLTCAKIEERDQLAVFQKYFPRSETWGKKNSIYPNNQDRVLHKLFESKNKSI